MSRGTALDALHRTTQFGQKGGDSYIVPQTILRVEGLVKIYGKRRVVDGVSFHVNQGEIVGLLGPNGAGKTTSFRMTCGLINTNGGVVMLGSQEVTNWPMYRRSREGGMGYLPQDKSVFQRLSVQNNLYGVMEMIGTKRSERKRLCDELLEKFKLTHLRRNFGGGLSGGERRRLEIARALVSRPKIILLDEPFANIDPITVHGIQQIIRQLADDGIAILITDHQVRETLQITERSYVIRAGQVLCHGTPEEVLNNPEARKVYFGEDVNVSGIHSGITAPAPLPRNKPSHGTGHRNEPHPSPDRFSEPIPEPVEPVGPATRILGRRSSSNGHSEHPRPERHEPVPPARPPRSNMAPLKSTSSSVLAEPRSVETEEYGSYQPPFRSPEKRLTSPSRLSECPAVRSQGAASPPPKGSPIATPPGSEPAPASSGVFRTLGNLIWGK